MCIRDRLYIDWINIEIIGGIAIFINNGKMGLWAIISYSWFISSPSFAKKSYNLPFITQKRGKAIAYYLSGLLSLHIKHNVILSWCQLDNFIFLRLDQSVDTIKIEMGNLSRCSVHGTVKPFDQFLYQKYHWSFYRILESIYDFFQQLLKDLF